MTSDYFNGSNETARKAKVWAQQILPSVIENQFNEWNRMLRRQPTTTNIVNWANFSSSPQRASKSSLNLFIDVETSKRGPIKSQNCLSHRN